MDVASALRRIRRTADLSQRQLARVGGVSQSLVARVEAGGQDVPVGVLGRLAALAGLRLALLDDATGEEVPGMDAGAVRDRRGRLFPAHLDPRHGDDRWWGGEHRPRLSRPRYTFDRDRSWRDGRRSDAGTPDDHQLPQPGDSLAERARRREAESRRRWWEEQERLRAAGPPPVRAEWTCACPPECADLDLGERPVHVPDCLCRCDVG